MVEANPFLGIVLHGVGAVLAATCFAPQGKTKGWSWQTYWLTMASFCWLILPIAGAALTVPKIVTVLSEAPPSAMMWSFGLGMFYGIGGTAFGLAIKAIGFSLTYAIAIGLSAVLGTLVPQLVRGELVETLSRPGSNWIIAGIVIGIVGIAFTGLAGRFKEKDLANADGKQEFFFLKGLLLAILAGFLSAVYGFALEAGDPIAEVATKHGAGIFAGNIIFIFANSGAFLTTTIYCLYLHKKHKSLGEMIELPQGTEKASLPLNYIMAILTGVFWYGQFFFYTIGHVRMGTYKFTSWAIHMIMLVLFSNLVGIAFKEWKGCKSKTRMAIGIAIIVLLGSVILLTYGNYVGGQESAH